MNILQSLETYTVAQKGVGTNFAILGVVLIIIALVFFIFASKTPLTVGIKWGALFAGLMIIAGGLSYYNFSNKTYSESEAIYQKDVTEFVQYEHERMEKVDKGFLTYQLTFALFVLVALVVIVFVKAPVLKGISFAVAILFIGMLLIEALSHSSIKKYTEELRIEVKK